MAEVTDDQIDRMAMLCGMLPPDEYRRPEPFLRALARECEPDQRRRAGRTTRLLLEILALACLGERRIAFIGANSALALCRDRLVDLARAAGIPVSLSERFTVRLLSDRLVSFRTPHGIRELAHQERACRLVAVIDHYAPEWERWWRRYPLPPWKMSLWAIAERPMRGTPSGPPWPEEPSRTKPLGIQATVGHGVFCCCCDCDPDHSREREAWLRGMQRMVQHHG